MSRPSDEARALNLIEVRGPFLCAVSIIHDDWFQTSDEPFALDPDGFRVEPEVAAMLIQSGKLIEVGKGHPADDPGTRITAYRVA